MLTNRNLIPILERARAALIENKCLDEVAEVSATIQALEEEVSEQDEWMKYESNKGNKSRLLVNYIADANCVLLWDFSSFITSILTKETLWAVLQEEARNPGFCRESLMGKGRKPTEVLALIQEATGVRVKKYDQKGRLEIDLDDLEI